MSGPRVTVTGLNEAIAAGQGQVAALVTSAMRETTTVLKTGLRQQVVNAGLGSRLANTWQATTYPTSGDSLDPAAFAWSKAPDIIDAFSRGAIIAPHGGRNYLWIPTRSVPRAIGSRGVSQKAMTPEQVLASFQQTEFVIKAGRGGSKLAYIVEDRGTTARGGVRRARKGRISHGARGQLVLMFVLRATVRMPKPLDLPSAAEDAASDFAARVTGGDS